MSWLSGKPVRVLSLLWPEHDAIIQRTSDGDGYKRSGSYSVLDDQVLRAFYIHGSNERSSTIYLAKIHDAIATNGTTVPFVRLATIPYVVHRIALLPSRAGFASLEFDKDTSSITLRTHLWDGSVSKEKTAHAAAAYGELVVNRHAVAVCVSSGQPTSQDMYLAGNTDVYHRVDAYIDPVLPEPRDHTGDQIVIWDTNSDTLKIVQIPQDELAPLSHQASFQFVGDSHIALGGTLMSSFGTPSALLKSFHIATSDKFSRTFTHGQNFELDDDIGAVAKPGSSGNNAILANYHHQGSRTTVVSNGLLMGDIASEPCTEDPEGLHAFWGHPQFSRTIEGTINEFLPSISDNRLLATVYLDNYNNPGYEKFGVNAQDHHYIRIIYLYDFDQARCNELCSLSVAGRITLEARLREENPNAQVSVVERNFGVGIEEEVDCEWPLGSQPPPEWMLHLQELYEIGESRRKGTAEIPVVDFDEAPAAQKGNPRILFTKSAVWFPDIRTVDYNNLALTTSAIVDVPSAGNEGHVFYFGDL